MGDYTLPDAVGLLGAATIVVTYFLLQIRRIDARSVSFSVANALGAAGIIYSLFYQFNLSAFAIEAFWLLISLYGIVRALHARNANEARSSIDS